MRLLPCPFCGRTPSEEYCQRRYDFDFAIECECGACLSQCEWAGGPGQESKEKTIEQWNARAGQWIACADRMPEPNVAVIVCCMECDDGEGPWIGGGFYVPEGWQSQDSCLLDKPMAFTVTHWMPMPSAPRTAPNTVLDGSDPPQQLLGGADRPNKPEKQNETKEAI